MEFHSLIRIDWTSVDGMLVWSALRMSCLTLLMFAASADRLKPWVHMLVPGYVIAYRLPKFVFVNAYYASLPADFRQDAAWLSLFNIISGLGVVIIAFGLIYRDTGIARKQGDPFERSRFECIYFSVVTWTTLGYGDLTPASRQSKLLMMYETFAGYLVLSVVAAQFLHLAHPI